MENKDELTMSVVVGTGQLALATSILLVLPMVIGYEVASRKKKGSKTEKTAKVLEGVVKTSTIVAGTCIWIHWVVKRNTQ